MNSYAILLRGVNVGGKNKVPMAELKKCLEQLGYNSVRTYIASGNVIVRSDKSPSLIKKEVEAELPKRFKLDSNLVKILVLSHAQLKAIIDNRPKGFGDQPDTYHSDAIFLMEDLSTDNALAIFDPRDGVDTIWPGSSVIYSQRVSALRTKSRLAKIIGTPIYQSMTIRNWNTTVKVLHLLDEAEATDKIKK